MLRREQHCGEREGAGTCAPRIGGGEIPGIQPPQKERPPEELLHDGDDEDRLGEAQAGESEVDLAIGTGRVKSPGVTEHGPAVVELNPHHENPQSATDGKQPSMRLHIARRSQLPVTAPEKDQGRSDAVRSASSHRRSPAARCGPISGTSEDTAMKTMKMANGAARITAGCASAAEIL